MNECGEGYETDRKKEKCSSTIHQERMKRKAGVKLGHKGE